MLDCLVEAKTVTIPRLLELAPAGTLDPSPFLYTSTLYSMAGLVAAAAILHTAITPVQQIYFQRSKLLEQKEQEKQQ